MFACARARALLRSQYVLGLAYICEFTHRPIQHTLSSAKKSTPARRTPRAVQAVRVCRLVSKSGYIAGDTLGASATVSSALTRSPIYRLRVPKRRDSHWFVYSSFHLLLLVPGEQWLGRVPYIHIVYLLSLLCCVVEVERGLAGYRWLQRNGKRN